MSHAAFAPETFSLRLKGSIEWHVRSSFFKLLLFSPFRPSAQTVFEVSSEPAMPQYELITLVAVAPFGYVEGGDAPFRYRAVVEAFEVYHHLYIEKLAISNSEGVADGVARSRRIALERLLDRLGYLPDEQSVKEVRWESPVALSFTLAETKLLIRDVREEPLRVEMKTE